MSRILRSLIFGCSLICDIAVADVDSFLQTTDAGFLHKDDETAQLLQLDRSKLKSCAADRSDAWWRSVDVRIGTGQHGHTFPGATLPWGMVQATPWIKGGGVNDWDLISGYNSEASNPSFIGMAHSSLSGAGSGEMGELRLLPGIGDVNTPEQLFLDMNSVDASPGLFRANLSKVGGRAEVEISSTATLRGAIHQFKFAAGTAPSISLLFSEVPNAFWGYTSEHRDFAQVSNTTVEGCIEGTNRGIGGALSVLCFLIKFDSEFEVLAKTQADMLLRFPGKEDVVTARVGISRSNVEHARAAFGDVATRSFDQVVCDARTQWNKELGVVQAQFSNDTHKRIFYSALYHSMISPNLLSDADGTYRLQTGYNNATGMHFRGDSFLKLDAAAPVQTVNKSDGHELMFHTFSLWDTYRSLHPLMNLLHPRMSAQFGHSLFAFLDTWGQLPSWQLLQSPAQMMEGDGGAIVLATMLRNGILARSDAVEVLLRDRTRNKRDNTDKRAVSNLLEQAKADACLALVMQDQGLDDDAVKWRREADAVFNLWDAKQQVFVPGDGSDVGDLSKSSESYVEASPLQYAWGAEFNLEQMKTLRGGASGFDASLDRFFAAKAQTGAADMTGAYGALSIGDEPTMHVPYLYSAVGKPWKTQRVIDDLMNTMFSDKPDGLPGNDDLGQMSSWLVFSMLGFYPMNPCSGNYELGRPLIDEAVLHLKDGKLKIKVFNQSPSNKYVSALRLDDEDLDLANPGLSHTKLLKARNLQIWMASEPPSTKIASSLPVGGAVVPEFLAVAVKVLEEAEELEGLEEPEASA